jgi:putative FmdB family regulatory protein
MPTYAYRCESCGVEFERVQKFTDKPLSRCPECRGKVRRVPQAAGVVFKGSGWYVNDSKSTRSTGPVKSARKGDEGASTESKGSETKPDAKPASSDD